MCKSEAVKDAADVKLKKSSAVWNLFAALFGAHEREYYAGKAQVVKEDLLIMAEILVFFVISETWMRVVLPGLGLQTGVPFPGADALKRHHFFFMTPIGYLFMYISTCGTITYLYDYVWPEEGKRLSIQGKNMPPEEMRKALGFAGRCIISSMSLSGIFYHVMRGESNIYFGLPQLSDLPWFMFVYLLVDMMQYSIHVVMHRPWWYQNVHKVHHMWKSPNAWIVSALHPAEHLAYTCPMLMLSVMMPISIVTFLTFTTIVYVFSAIDHSGLNLHETYLCRLFWWQAPPEFHDRHHELFHVNYGVMVDWWDRMAGTYYNPDKDGGKAQFKEDNFTPLRARKTATAPQ
eukprot:TRINITY_DN76014_c0_g1_i1.p1 TRINITY_DN76014_c0_g1~~TRINITY_DN76014_c0_g1_i1.p1  ORF type:complete len:346 (+),score=70.53 TRINITY_DN76014_c0_g1_i1:92-1129(+)